LHGTEPDQLEQLARRYGLLAVALTQGARGSMLWLDGLVVSRPAAVVKVVDTVGAGDSYTAALALGLLAGEPADKIIEQAHRVAEYVCTQPGAIPALLALVFL